MTTELPIASNRDEVAVATLVRMRRAGFTLRRCVAGTETQAPQVCRLPVEAISRPWSPSGNERT
jgi:hypothetical protein